MTPEALKKYSHESIFPIAEEGTDGLTRHEYVTVMLLQGLLANHGTSVSPDVLLDAAVELAKKLLDRTW